MTARTPAHPTGFVVHRSTHAVPADDRERLLADPGFGRVFTEHMARMTWTVDGGWAQRRIEPYGPLPLEPAALVLHYGQEVFEGLKAFRHPDGSIWSFRPTANAQRLAASARRLALPEVSEEDFLESVRALVEVDQTWVPRSGEASLYLRPVMFAAEASLMVRAGHRVEYVVIASPAGPYFSGGVRPVSIWVAKDLHRASPGGTGSVKTMANYGASLASQAQAQEHGCEQVCFLDAATGRNLEELAAMNLVVVRADGTVLSPATSETTLAGITRDSILTLLAESGHEVVETELPLDEVLSGVRTGEVSEVFACGTGAVVTPVGRLVGHDFDESVAGGVAGAVTMQVRRQLTDIQHGHVADSHGWMHRLVGAKPGGWPRTGTV